MHRSYKSVFQTPDGEKVLRHILKVGNVTSSSFVAGDSHLTAFREGQRHLALSIFKFVSRDHEKLIEQIEKGTEDDSFA